MVLCFRTLRGDGMRVSRKKPPPLPDNDEGHTERLRRAVDRSRRVLGTKLAQYAIAPKLGTEIHLSIQLNARTSAQWISNVRRDHVDRALLDQAAALTRVFTLDKEEINGCKVAESILRFASSSDLRRYATQLGEMWKAQPFTRTFMMKELGGRQVTPPGGISDSIIGDRVLYSDLVHADDSSDVLEHVSDEEKAWSLSGLVGDRMALIAHQEWLISCVRPDICEAPTPWAGDHTTIFRRLGGLVEEALQADADSARNGAESTEPVEGVSTHDTV